MKCTLIIILVSEFRDKGFPFGPYTGPNLLLYTLGGNTLLSPFTLRDVDPQTLRLSTRRRSVGASKKKLTVSREPVRRPDSK